MQYSLLVFKIVFYNTCNITDGPYKGVSGGKVVVRVGGQAEGGPSLPLSHRQCCCALSRRKGCMYTNHRIDRDSHWQQLGTQPILISAPQWANRPCNAPTRFYRVGKKPSVKADLVTYSHTVDVRGQQCMSKSLILRHHLDFSACDIMVSFCKSSHILENEFSLDQLIC